MARFLTCAETARLVRQALREAFPGFRFGVRSKTYAGGASINVEWVDGPATADVNAIVRRFEGAYFCGMTDYKGQVYNELDGEAVTFGADYIFTQRNYTEEFINARVAEVIAEYGFDATVTVQPAGRYTGALVGDIFVMPETEARGFGALDVRKIIADRMREFGVTQPQACPTTERVVCTGDDGYGYGRTGRIAA